MQNIGELTALQWAAERGKATLAKLAISRGADVSEPNQLLFGRTPLNSAALCGDPAVIEILVEHGAKVNARYYQTPLHLAVVSGDVEAIKVLLKLGSDALAIDTLGDIPAHSSYVSRGSLKVLIDAGFDISTKGSGGRTVLHHAASRQKEILEYLFEQLEGYMAINTQDSDGKTPLHLASTVENIRLLLRLGADAGI